MHTTTTVKHLPTECLLMKGHKNNVMIPYNLCETLAPNSETTLILLHLLKETNPIQNHIIIISLSCIIYLKYLVKIIEM